MEEKGISSPLSEKRLNRKERVRQSREKRRQEISLLRTMPYSEHQRWWSSDTIAVVTGANRGIGYETVHQLATHGLTVILTSRDVAVGEEAVKVLRERGLSVVFHQLDIVVPSSVETLAEWIKQTYGGLDILWEIIKRGRVKKNPPKKQRDLQFHDLLSSSPTNIGKNGSYSHNPFFPP